MRIGFISHTLPMDPETRITGVYQRMGMFIDALKTLGALDILFFVKHDMEINPSVLAEIRKYLCEYYGADISLQLCNMAPPDSSGNFWQEYVEPAIAIDRQAPYAYTTQPEQLQAIRLLLSRKPDILFCHRLRCVVPMLLAHQNTPPIYFDLDDIEHVALARSIKQPPKWRGKPLRYMQLLLLRYWEERAIKTSRSTFVCSEKDRDYLSRTFKSRNIFAIPNAVEIPSQSALKEKKKSDATALFLGHMAYPPNTIGADYLINKIWPFVSSGHPQARLLVAGAEPERISSYGKKPSSVEFLGFVEDIDDLYRTVDVVLCPILSGGGTRIKILEAAAHVKPVVSTTVGAEGIDFQNGKEIILRDKPEDFAQACVDLLKNRALSRQIGTAAYVRIVEKYSRNQIIQQIKKHLEDSIRDLRDNRHVSSSPITTSHTGVDNNEFQLTQADTRT